MNTNLKCVIKYINELAKKGLIAEAQTNIETLQILCVIDEDLYEELMEKINNSKEYREKDLPYTRKLN